MTTPLEVLKSTFGFSAFREGQEAVITRLIEGHAVLAVFPTGAGKSLCYQLPALMLDGLTLVISPLIALMKDQIDVLVSRRVEAARLDSTVDGDTARDVYRKLRNGTLKILYVAPERLANERFLQLLADVKIAMLAVDEAHCISEWGHNFRPEYMKIAAMAKRLGVRRVLALTATATPSVGQQIAAAFDIAREDMIQTGFYRPNLSIMISPVADAERKSLLANRIKRRDRGPGIVYVTLQRTAELVAAYLSAAGIPAMAYHAGMDSEKRHAVQDEFMSSSDLMVVATIAFGMGIDKSNIRSVYHFNVPKSLENYAQEIGRAGRDGKPSVCEMLVCADDIIPLENFTFGDTPTRESVAGIVEHVLQIGDEFDVSVYDLSSTYDIKILVVETLLTYLELDEYLLSTGPFYTEYKFQMVNPLATILEGFDPQRAAFLKRVFAQAKKGRMWQSIDLHAAAEAIGEPRDRLMKAFQYLEERGDLIVKPSGVRRGYRRLKKVRDLTPLIDELNERFALRETRDIERLEQVLAMASHDGCHTNSLLAYFGEIREGDCGHCGWCKGHRPGPVGKPTYIQPGESEKATAREVLRERHAALASPRQVAKFLCGISSPATVRVKLTKDHRFGIMAEVPFREVMKLAEG